MPQATIRERHVDRKFTTLRTRLVSGELGPHILLSGESNNSARDITDRSLSGLAYSIIGDLTPPPGSDRQWAFHYALSTPRVSIGPGWI